MQGFTCLYIYRIENLKRYYVCEKIYLVNCQNVGWSGKNGEYKNFKRIYRVEIQRGEGKTLLQWCWDFY